MHNEYSITRTQTLEFRLRINNGPISFKTLGSMISDIEIKLSRFGYTADQTEVYVQHSGNCQYLVVAIKQADETEKVQVCK